MEILTSEIQIQQILFWTADLVQFFPGNFQYSGEEILFPQGFQIEDQYSCIEIVLGGKSAFDQPSLGNKIIAGGKPLYHTPHT